MWSQYEIQKESQENFIPTESRSIYLQSTKKAVKFHLRAFEWFGNKDNLFRHHTLSKKIYLFTLNNVFLGRSNNTPKKYLITDNILNFKTIFTSLRGGRN